MNLFANIDGNIFINNNNKNSFNGRVFLCTTYNNEAETIYVQLWRLYDYVDKFIIVISNKTYQGRPKNFTFKPFEKEIERYKDKIDIANFDHVCNRKLYRGVSLSRCMERSQRDYTIPYMESKYNLTEKDLIISVDIDEILTREGIQYIKKHPPNNYKHIFGTLYFPYYYHNVEEWHRGLVIRYNKRMKSLSHFRMIRVNTSDLLRYDYNFSKPLITHCSYCFKNIEEYRNKLQSFGHSEFNNNRI